MVPGVKRRSWDRTKSMSHISSVIMHIIRNLTKITNIMLTCDSVLNLHSGIDFQENPIVGCGVEKVFKRPQAFIFEVPSNFQRCVDKWPNCLTRKHRRSHLLKGFMPLSCHNAVWLAYLYNLLEPGIKVNGQVSRPDLGMLFTYAGHCIPSPINDSQIFHLQLSVLRCVSTWDL